MGHEVPDGDVIRPEGEDHGNYVIHFEGDHGNYVIHFEGDHGVESESGSESGE